MVLLKRFPYPVLDHRGTNIVRNGLQTFAAVFHANAQPCFFQHLFVVHTVSETNGILQWDMEIIADIFHRNSFIDFSVITSPFT